MQIATVISATATWGFAGIRSIGWGWTGVIWLYNIITYMLLDPLKFLVRYSLSGKAWGLVVEKRVSIAKSYSILQKVLEYTINSLQVQFSLFSP